jgi:hypothetical protein
MPKWVDDNTVEGEMSEEAFWASVHEEMAERMAKEEKEGRPGNYGNDGTVEVFSEEQEYKGIHYRLAVIRYFAVRRLPDGTIEPSGHKGMNSIGKWVVVESKTRPPSDLRDLLHLDDFLWHETIHAGQENWSLRQQWEYAVSQAQNDVLLIEGLAKAFDEKVASLQKELVTWLHTLKK